MGCFPVWITGIFHVKQNENSRIICNTIKHEDSSIVLSPYNSITQ
jgi:hypothetical protein